MARRKKAKTRYYFSRQNMMLLDHFGRHGHITPMSALVNYGIARLASRIDELRKMGAPITTTMKVVNGKRYAHYAWTE